MNLLALFSDYSTLTLLVLALLAFTAGFIDAIVGGGGLIQLPALLIKLPDTHLPALFGTNKIAALSGTAVAAYRYSKRIKYNFRLLAILSAFSFAASAMGAKTLSYIDPNTLRPLILVILIIIVIYTFFKKDLGSIQTKSLPFTRQVVYGAIIATVVGFYDGFFGPGTGSFFILGFVVILGFEFVQASAYAKVINCFTNISALIVFISQGNYLAEIALIMAVSNVAGSFLGIRLALRNGNGFIRMVFLIIVSIMIARYSYDIFMEYYF